MLSIQLLFLFNYVVLIKAECEYSPHTVCETTTTPISNYFAYLTMSWPGTYCLDNCCHAISEINEGFTIHGYWPQRGANEYQYCCTTDWKTDEITNYVNNNAYLRDALRYYWPGLKRCSFFNYEYLKHGTCLPTLTNGENGPLYYADIALGIANKTNAWSELKKKGVVDNGITAYKTETIREYFHDIYGVYPLLFCNENGYMDEDRLCTQIPTFPMRANATLYDCPESFRAEVETCGETIIFSPFPTYDINDICPY